jgi:regulator of sirC expression with transglutaminase-like and TPR domain
VPEAELDLGEAALLIARDEYPTLSVPAYLKRLDELSEAARKHVGKPRGSRAVVERLNSFLFDDEGFRGNTDDYYDPKNSYLNEVLDRRIGIPITLSVLYMEVGKRLGYAIEGVGLPGHFIVRMAGTTELFVDPFNRGDILDRDDCLEKVRRLFGAPVEDSPALLAVASKTQIMLRMLNNLKAIYLRQELFDKALPVVDKILLLDSENPQERRDRALVLLRLKKFSEARVQLAAFLDVCPKEEENQEMINEATQLLGWLSQLN